jgi:hypothetical protein
MASKPHPDWSEAQKAKFKVVQEALDIAIPYHGQEIPRLDNNSREQVCDQLGVVKQAAKVLEKAENTLKERFKPLLGDDTELRTSRYEATLKGSVRTALNQGLCKELLAAADGAGLDLNKLMVALGEGQFTVPNGCELDGDATNEQTFFGDTEVKTLKVTPL